MRPARSVPLLVLAMVLAGCELLPPRPIAVAETPVVAAGAFDRARADVLVAEATEAAARGDDAAALDGFRAAGLAWPEHQDAWQGLRDAADRLGQVDESAGAEFMLRRVRLYDGADLFVQREVNRALQRFIAEGGVPNTGQPTLTYAQVLADYYTERLVASGVYEPPDAYLNVEGREWPAVIGTGLAVGIYSTVLGVSAGNP